MTHSGHSEADQNGTAPIGAAGVILVVSPKRPS